MSGATVRVVQLGAETLFRHASGQVLDEAKKDEPELRLVLATPRWGGDPSVYSVSASNTVGTPRR